MSVKVTSNLDKTIPNIIKRAIDDANKELAPKLTQYARTHHVYKNRTGRLTRNTIAKSLREELSLYAQTFYAGYVIEKTEDNWLQRTIIENEKLILDTYKKYINKYGSRK